MENKGKVKVSHGLAAISETLRPYGVPARP